MQPCMMGWISWKSMHFFWKDDSPLWILCVRWCQIERAAHLRLRLGNLLHLHTSACVESKRSVHTNKWRTTHNALCGYYKFSFRIGMNFMKVHAFLLKGWFSSLNTLCELVSNRKSSSSSSSASDCVTSTCYPRFKNMKWFWQDKHDSREL
jgi:hypothetical protein